MRLPFGVNHILQKNCFEFEMLLFSFVFFEKLANAQFRNSFLEELLCSRSYPTCGGVLKTMI